MMSKICCVGLFYIFPIWFGYQEHRMHSEKEIVEILVARKGYHLMDSDCYFRRPGYGVPQDVQWSLSRWRYGCLYPPIVYVRVANNYLDLKTWNQLQSFRYLESLWLQDCRLDPDADFSSFRHLRELTIAEATAASGTSLSLRQVRSIAKLSQLDDLWIDVEAKDEWLQYIGRLRRLKTLGITGKDISDEGVAKLAVLRRLTGLSLAGTNITSKSASVLSQFKNLQWLNLSNTKIDDGCLKQLSDLPSLEVLRLDNTQITNAGLALLAQCSSLQDLWLTNTNISDAGIKHLSKLKGLRHLCLVGTRITNECIPALATFPFLPPSKYSIENTKIDELGLERWQKDVLYKKEGKQTSCRKRTRRGKVGD